MGGGTTAASEHREAALPLLQPRHVPWQLSSQFQEFSRCLGALQPAGKAADCPGRPARHRRRCSTAWEGRAALALVWRPGGALRQCVCTPKASPCCHRALEHPGAHVGEGGDGSAREGAPQPRASTGKPPCLCCSPGMSPGSCPASSRSFRGVWALSSRQGRRPIAPEDRHGIGVAAAQRGRAGQPWRWRGGLGVLFGSACARPRHRRAATEPWNTLGRTWVKGETAVHGRGHHSRERAPGSRPASVAAPACPLAAVQPVRGVFEVSGRSPAGREGGRLPREDRHGIGVAAAQRGRAGQPWRWCGGLGVLFGSACARPRHRRAATEPWNTLGRTWVKGETAVHGRGHHSRERAPGSRPASVAAPACPLAAVQPVPGVFEVSGRSPAGREGGRLPRKTGTASASLQHSVGGQGSPGAGVAAWGCSSAVRVHAQGIAVLPQSPGTPWGARG